MLAYLTDPIEPAVTLAEVKAHLHIDDDTETDMLQQYMAAATQEAEHHLCREIIKRNDDKAVCDSIEDVPSAIKQVILARVASFYSQREDMGERQLSTYYRNLLDPWILYSREDEEYPPARVCGLFCVLLLNV